MHDNDNDISYDGDDRTLKGEAVFLVIDDEGKPQGIYEDNADAEEAALACDGDVYTMVIQ